MDSVILSSPLALLLYGAALFLCLFDRQYQASKGLFTILSAILSLAATAYSLILGAGLWEGATVLLIFLLLNMGVKE